mgnify:FL=1
MASTDCLLLYVIYCLLFAFVYLTVEISYDLKRMNKHYTKTIKASIIVET